MAGARRVLGQSVAAAVSALGSTYVSILATFLIAFAVISPQIIRADALDQNFNSLQDQIEAQGRGLDDMARQLAYLTNERWSGSVDPGVGQGSSAASGGLAEAGAGGVSSAASSGCPVSAPVVQTSDGPACVSLRAASLGTGSATPMVPTGGPADPRWRWINPWTLAGAGIILLLARVLVKWRSDQRGPEAAPASAPEVPDSLPGTLSEVIDAVQGSLPRGGVAPALSVCGRELTVTAPSAKLDAVIESVSSAVGELEMRAPSMYNVRRASGVIATLRLMVV